MGQSKTGSERLALERIFHASALSTVVPDLEPAVLHQVIQRYGLEDCSELLAFVTPTQLTQLFDLDLWRADRPGEDEHFDAQRVGVWIESLAAAGPSVAAAKLAAIDVDVVIAGFAQHARVFDHGAVADYETTDGQIIKGGQHLEGLVTADVGGFIVVARRQEAWESIVSVLTALGDEHPACFREVMAGCRDLSNSRPEVDGLDNLLETGDQAMLDVGIGREDRREQLGYVSVADAHAFLTAARKTKIPAAARTPTHEPRTLLPAVRGSNASAFAERTEEIAFLANTLKAGCSLQSRAFTPQEAWDGAIAVCRLGQDVQGLSDPLADQDVIKLFQVGWTTLHDDVAMSAASGLAGVLKQVWCNDRETQRDLKTLRVQLTKHLRTGTPWLARGAMDVLAILDQPSWAMLLGLIAEFPVIVTNGATSFEFIAERRQLHAVEAFVRSLDEALLQP